jgi:preprotein translocase subunit SecA
VRKHLLEYDDVLNKQRASVYEQRNRIFVKDDLSEDVTEMLQSEVNRRVPGSLDDADGPWKLLAWLDQIQPPLVIDRFIYPSYTLRLILEHILQARTDPLQALALPSGDGSAGDGTAGDKSALAERLLPPRIDPQAAYRALVEVVDESLKAEADHILRGVANLLGPRKVSGSLMSASSQSIPSNRSRMWTKPTTATPAQRQPPPCRTF